MTIETIVFLGPTLAQEEAKNYLSNAVFARPVRCGDIYQCMSLKPKRLVIIDGFFEQCASIWHKEILYAIESGVEVYGASSMGALRAAELSVYGMRGFGEIFKNYQAGIIDGDDEVSLPHTVDNSSYSSRVTPLVNVRATLNLAVVNHVVKEEIASDIIAELKSQPYFQRDFFKSLHKRSIDPGWFRENYIDQKKNDAIALLQYLSKNPIGAQPNTQLVVPRTFYMRLMYRKIMCMPFAEAYPWLPSAEKALFNLSEKENALLQSCAMLLQAVNAIKAHCQDIKSCGFDRAEFITFYRLYVGLESEASSPKLLRLIEKMAALFETVFDYFKMNHLETSSEACHSFFNEFRHKNGLVKGDVALAWFAERGMSEKVRLPLFIEYLSVYEFLFHKDKFDLFDTPVVFDNIRWIVRAYRLFEGEE